MKKYLGIDIGGGSIRGSVVDESGKIYSEHRETTDRFSENEAFLSAVERVIEKNFKSEKFEKIGIGSPGPIDIDTGFIFSSANLVNLKNTPIIPHIEKKFNLPVRFNNDANCAALGEFHFGKGKGFTNLIVLTLGTGLGGGWINNGKIYNGYKGNGMEAGHVTVVMNGAKCGCGQNGCAESYFSARGLVNRYKDSTGDTLGSAADFFSLVQKGNPVAMQVLDFGINALAELIRNLIHITNTEKIIFVGGLTRSYDIFGKQLIEKVNEIIFPVFRNYTKIEVGSTLAGTLGAAALCFEI
ncbi:MAG: ROK family protein [Leptospira sp.]|nr:ROK family protein [Leptospira sp.]